MSYSEESTAPALPPFYAEMMYYRRLALAKDLVATREIIKAIIGQYQIRVYHREHFEQIMLALKDFVEG